MEYIVGDPVSSAQWVYIAPTLEVKLQRAHQILRETLWIDDRVLKEDDTSITWIPGSHVQRLSFEEFDEYVFIKSSIDMFEDFLEPEDGSTLANNLNRNIAGGTHIFDRDRNVITVDSYVVVTCWWDLSLFIYALRTLLAHVEKTGGTGSITRWNFCQPALTTHPELGPRLLPHPLFIFPYPDMTQLAFVGGIPLFRRECDEILENQKRDLENYSRYFPEIDLSSSRGMETLDVNYLIETDETGNGFFNGQVAEVGQLYSEWTSFGWAVTTHVALPYFTESQNIPRGMGTMQDAIDTANVLNRVFQLSPVHPLGIGTFWANRDQLSFTISVPHVCIEPVMHGMNRTEISALFASLAEPEFIRRIVDMIDLTGKESGYRTTRQITSDDRLAHILSDRQHPQFIRGLDADLSDELAITWGYPTKPLLVLGIFDYLNSQITSLELTRTTQGHQLRQRVRTANAIDEDLSIQDLSDDPEIAHSQIVHAVASLGTYGVVPDFIWIPQGHSEIGHDWTNDGVEAMCINLASEHDLSTIADRMWANPNPWARTFSDDLGIVEAPFTEGLSPSERYRKIAAEPTFIDYNIAMLRAFWQGSTYLLMHPEEERAALEEVDRWIEMFQDRMRGFGNHKSV